MPVSIIACPKCRTMMFSDTVQCPACRHILDESKQLVGEKDTSTPSTSTSSDEVPCPNCQEMVRTGLVRCWNCSAFMQDDIAESYRRMQSSPQRVIYSEVPAEIVGSHGDGDAQQTFHAEDRDFELSEGIGTFKTSAASAPAPAAPAPQAETPPADTSEGDTYSLAAPAEPPAAAPPSQPAAEQTQQSGDQQLNETQPAAGGEANGDAPKVTEELPAVDHSVATGGDALLEVALQEEAEQKKRRKHRRERRKIGPRSETGLLVFCPNGHRVEVQERHRGLTGRCPKCRSPFFVPPKPVEEKPAEDGAAEADAAESTAAGKYEQWMTDVRVHAVNPERLKLKANSLKNEFRLFDLGFAPDELLAGSFTKKKGTAGATSKKRLADREAMIEGLREGKTPDDTPLVEATSLTVEHAQQVRVVQPAAYAHESMFAGIEVFGERLIAVRIPTADENAPLFISFPLSEFRRFAELMSQYYSVQDLGTDCGVPMADTFTEVQCHYSEEKFKVLENVEFYQADSSFEIELAGRRCQECGLVVSEDSRKKEKIGGANGKGIAKANCPKCTKKFGDISLFTLKVAETAETAAEEGDGSNDEKPGEPAEESAATTAQT